MARRRRRRKPRTGITVVVLSALGALGSWWILTDSNDNGTVDSTLALTPLPALTTDRPEVPPPTLPRPGIPEKGHNSPVPASSEQAELPAKRAKSLIRAGRQSLGDGDAIAARAYFSEAVGLGVDGADVMFARAELTRVGTEPIFSPRIFENDPYVSTIHHE